MNTNINYQTVGRRIRKLRLEQNMTQETLGEYAGISPAALSYIENGRKHVSLDSLSAIAYALGVTVDALLYGSVEHVTTRYGTDLDEILSSCASSERLFLSEMIRAIKKVLHDHGWHIT